MADTLIDLAGGGLTPLPCNPPRPALPFEKSVPADVFARTIDRDFMILATSFEANRRLTTRTSYTNLAQYSNAAANVYWNSNSFLTPTDNIIANPDDGQLTASKLTETADTGAHYVGRASITITAGDSICWSRMFKAGSSSLVQLQVGDGSSNGFYANFDLANGVVSKVVTVIGTGTATSQGIVNLGGGWFRCHIIGKVGAASTAAQPYALAINSSTAAASPSYLGSTANYFYAYGALFETNVTAPGPCITTTSASRAVSVPDIDAIANPSSDLADYFSFLCAEPAAAPTGVAGLASFTRTFARIPAPQYKTISKFVDRPVMDDVTTGSAWAVSIDEGVTSSVFTARKSVVPGFLSAAINSNACTAHGFVAGDYYVFWSGNRIVARGLVIASIDADHFSTLASELMVASTATLTCNVSKNAVVRYINGTVEADCQEVTTFYLLGFSINGAATVNLTTDIPLATVQMDPVAWLTAIEAYRASPSPTLFAVESPQGKTPYMGQIIGYTYTRVQLADVYDTQAV